MTDHPTLRLVLGDQLNESIASLKDVDPARDVVLMAEVLGECTYVRHHPKKIALVFSAMRHFAQRLRDRGVSVDYVQLDDPGNSGSLRGELCRAVERHAPQEVIVTAAGEWRLLEDMRGWSEACGRPVEIRDDDRFLCSQTDFARWARGRKTLRMEYFYRELRKRYGLLMAAEGTPEGGQWNFDADNRKRIPADLAAPVPLGANPDATTEEVLALVEQRFGHHFGDLRPFDFAVTHEDAEQAFEAFVTERLPRFGDYQDAMRDGDDFLFHAVISIYLNIGLLDPLAVCRRAERAYRDGEVPLNAAEGFIRQILGWREYIRGIYWHQMPDYAQANYFGASRPLPSFYWTGETEMNCLRSAVGQTRRQAYAHHIQRLMVTGNFALLAGIDPTAVNYWYLVVYADAFEWVELPNTHGMALFADGGLLASKPYAASGKYIGRMSDYCKSCRYRVQDSDGDKACPFNYLYWNFIIEHQDKLRANPRMAMVYRNLDRKSDGDREALRRRAQRFLENLDYAEEGAW